MTRLLPRGPLLPHRHQHSRPRTQFTTTARNAHRDQHHVFGSGIRRNERDRGVSGPRAAGARVEGSEGRYVEFPLPFFLWGREAIIIGWRLEGIVSVVLVDFSTTREANDSRENGSESGFNWCFLHDGRLALL